MRVGNCHLACIANLIAGTESGGRQALKEVRAIGLQILVAVATGQRILLTNLVIDLDFVVIDSLLIISLREKVVIVLAWIGDVYRWQRVKVEYPARDRTNQIRRNDVVGERLSCKWIKDLRKLAKVSVARLHCWDG